MKYPILVLSICLLLSACSLPPKYVGEKFPLTNHVDVFYSAAEVQGRHYKVIGHLSSHKYEKSILQKNLSEFGRRAGGDAIIISGTTADVLKYDN